MAESEFGGDSNFKNLEKTRIGKLFIDFAELTMMATGAVDSLIEGIKAFGR